MYYRMKLNGTFEFSINTPERDVALEKFQNALMYTGTMEDPTYDILFLPEEKDWKCRFFFMANFAFESDLNNKEEAAAEFLTDFEHLGETIELDYQIEQAKPRVLKKEPGKDPEIVEVDATYLSDLAQFFFGEKVIMQRIALDSANTFWMLVDEDGLMKKLPRNFLMATGGRFFSIQKIVGTAIFARSNFADVFNEEIYDYEIRDLDADHQKVVDLILSDSVQKALNMMFEDYDSGCIFVEEM